MVAAWGLTTLLTARTTRGSAAVGRGGGVGYGRGAGPAVGILGDAAAASCRGGAGGLSSWWRRKKRRRVMGMTLGVPGRLRSSSSAPRMLAFFFICLGAVCLLLYGRHQGNQGRAPTHGPPGRGGRTRSPSVTIFSAPRPMASSSLVGQRQELAVRSWLALSPYVSVVLFGRHPSIFAFAAALGPRVSVDSAIDFTFLGTPFFHTMVAKSQASHSDVSVLIDPEIILFPDFITTLSNTVQLDHDWLLVSIPRSVSNFSLQLNDNRKWWPPEVGETRLEKLQEILGQKLHGDHCSGRVLLAWNKGNAPLHGGVLPPFVYGKGFHNQWLINEALSSELRLIIDASEAFLNVYPEALGQEDWLLLGPGSEYGDKRTWETDGNSNLAAVYGSIYLKRNKYSNLVKLVLCSGHYFFMNAAEGMVYFLESLHQKRSESRNSLLDEDLNRSLLFRKRFMQTMVEKRWRTCLDYNGLPYREDKCSVNEFLKVDFTLPPSLLLPFSLESLLQMTADEHKTVVLSVAGYSYRDMLMSWVCRLRHLSITNFIVGALDSDIYQFSVLQGLPVFKDPLAPNNISTNDCHFGSECFQRVTKVKSRLVLQILKLGFNVLLSDVDVYWFHNPLPYLHSFGPATFVAQSDEYNETGPINLPRRLNSGFYFARSDAPTISAMEKVVKHASTSKLSEQPSFYDVLCGESGINRISHNQCIEPDTNLTVTFLDRYLFPNGAFRGLWEKQDVEAACLKKGCLILHNNWISGRVKKLERQVLSGLWAYNASSRMCLQHWKMANS